MSLGVPWRRFRPDAFSLCRIVARLNSFMSSQQWSSGRYVDLGGYGQGKGIFGIARRERRYPHGTLRPCTLCQQWGDSELSLCQRRHNISSVKMQLHHYVKFGSLVALPLCLV